MKFENYRTIIPGGRLYKTLPHLLKGPSEKVISTSPSLVILQICFSVLAHASPPGNPLPSAAQFLHASICFWSIAKDKC